ncbi:MAG: N-acetylglucosamine-6-phosphate deacetylase [Armatimonadota bacterium]
MGGTLVIINARILLQNDRMIDAEILIERGMIVDIGVGLKADREIDADGATVVPGLIDLHVHGIENESASDGSLARFAEIEARHGATTFYPTLFGPPDLIIDQLRRHLSKTDDLRMIPQVPGFRLESPYLHHTGAGISKDIVPISEDVTQSIIDAGKGHIRIWDISPELPGAIELISGLSDWGIVCSLGHTYASIDQARSAIDAGARLVTHLFDTFELPVMTDPGVYPAGLVDYLLTEDRVVCEIIADGTHVHPILVEKALRCKSIKGAAFVTDGNLGAGLPPGEYELPGGWGRVVINGSNDGVRIPDRGMILAGSALTPIDLLRNAVLLFGRDLVSASAICSAVPARLMGLNKGQIAVGRDADLIMIDDDFRLRYTISAGCVVYTNSNI